jgi:hypothetical protein
LERVTFILQLSLTLLVILAGAIFAVAEGRTGIPAITIPVAIVSFLLVDYYKAWRPPLVVQNALGLVAFGLAGFELILSDIEAPLLSGGHLLSYLTCAFLLQPKGRRQFWWLAALCLLQVAISAVLTYDGWFGLAMPVFLLLMLWTLSVFQLQRAAESAAAAQATDVRSHSTSSSKLWLGHSSSTPAIQMDDQHRWVTPRFVSSVLTGTGLSVVLAGMFFLFIPRVWPSTLPIMFDGGRPIGGAPSRTGFTSQITLGHIGEIQESPRVALESRLYALDGQTPLDWREWLPKVGGEPRFRGATQEVYDDGRWSRWEGAEGSREPFQDFPRIVPAEAVQTVRIFHGSPVNDGDVVFSCGLPLRCKAVSSPRSVQLELSGWTMLAAGRRRNPSEVEYQAEVIAWEPWFPNHTGELGPAWRLHPSSSRHYLFTSKHLHPELLRDLDAWLADHPQLTQPTSRQYELAKRWEEWFVYGDEFSYSLNLAVKNTRLDPILDFLRNTRRGHCEYFASALALLLRTQGIPTRVVSGYKGGQLGADGALVVRDLHAHLWVEAFVVDAPADPLTFQYGPRWVTLDPTPAARDAIVQSQEAATESWWSRMKAGWQTVWSSSIRMTQSDQQILIYDPIQAAATTLGEKALRTGRLGIEWWRMRKSPQEWFSWQGGLFAFMVLLALVGCVTGLRAVARRLGRGGRRKAPIDPRAASIPFYRRLESLLSRYGFTRSPAQTPREFIIATGPELAARMPSGLQRVPSQLTERFYSARYGGEPLSARDAETAEQELDVLERELEADSLRREARSPAVKR